MTRSCILAAGMTIIDFNEYCVVCGKPLPLDRDAGRRKYCGQVCRNAHNVQLEQEARIERRGVRPLCPWCGSKLGDLQREDAVFCSRKCGLAHFRASVRKRRLEELHARPPCLNCGKPLSIHRRKGTDFCSEGCSQRHRVAVQNRARLSAKKDRPPCRVCGGQIPTEHRGDKVYCSVNCRVAARPRQGFTCLHCGTFFTSQQRRAKFCSPRCNIHWQCWKPPSALSAGWFDRLFDSALPRRPQI